MVALLFTFCLIELFALGLLFACDLCILLIVYVFICVSLASYLFFIFCLFLSYFCLFLSLFVFFFCLFLSYFLFSFKLFLFICKVFWFIFKFFLIILFIYFCLAIC